MTMTAPSFSDITLSDPDEMMKVTNNQKTPLTWLGFRREYTIQPGQQAFVPFWVCCLYLGDPRSVRGQAVPFRTPSGDKGVVPDRRAELVRLSIHYGLYHNNLAQLPNKAPRVTVLTLTDREIQFPIDHPDGVTYSYDTDQTQNIDVKTELDRTRQMAMDMQRRIEQLESAQAADDPEAGEATEDTPLGM
jgi:hypothetical protein